jgi:hypothetical protein
MAAYQTMEVDMICHEPVGAENLGKRHCHGEKFPA